MASRQFDLPSGAFRFEMGLRRGEIAFFQNTAADAQLLAERGRWLDADPALYAAALPDSEPLLREAAAFARAANPAIEAAPSPASLGRTWAPDFLLLAPDENGVFTLRAACVCFPSHWDLGEKMGRPLAEIHAPVPTLNATLGRQIDTFLAALKPGVVWERWNWGLAATPERNNHPALGLPRITADTPPDRLWLRVEHQAFARLAGTGGVLFAIRLLIEPLTDVIGEPGAAARLADLLASMPEEVAAYKGLGAGRAALIRRLRAAGS